MVFLGIQAIKPNDWEVILKTSIPFVICLAIALVAITSLLTSFFKEYKVKVNSLKRSIDILKWTVERKDEEIARLEGKISELEKQLQKEPTTSH